jgi:hypothetical protein
VIIKFFEILFIKKELSLFVHVAKIQK